MKSIDSISGYKRKPGIYCIENTVTRKRYVGQTANLQRRIDDHINAFKRGKSHSKAMQRDLDEHGASSFCFYVLEVLPCGHARLLNFYEHEWTQNLKPEYGGYLWKHPVTLLIKQLQQSLIYDLKCLRPKVKQLRVELQEATEALDRLERRMELTEQWLDRATLSELDDLPPQNFPADQCLVPPHQF